ncbi:MAG: hypothetical protein KDC80_15070 [Saprospiraceae bacterium]|nr:hypothetical protein [Saprospiraceae bacterium]
MKRIEFLRKAGLSLFTTSALVACVKDSELDVVDGEGTSSEGSNNGSSAQNCSVTNSETAGPFPTKDPSSLVRNDIRNDREGVQMDVNITIKDATQGCTVLSGVIVDIWHCDANGYYSEYGGTQMQSANFSNVHFLRGRQTTDADGLVKFTSIFPGWYSGRATHIHVHVYDSSGKSLLVTQIAFSESVCDHVFTNATNFYKNGTQDTSNERDNVFSDGYENELASISGSISDGYTLEHTIVVNA